MNRCKFCDVDDEANICGIALVRCEGLLKDKKNCPLWAIVEQLGHE